MIHARKPSLIQHIAVLAIVFLFASKASADQPWATSVDGRLFQTGTSNPLKDPTLSFTLQILNPGKDCVLYEETQVYDTNVTNGYFSLKVGSAAPDLSGRRTSNDPGYTMARIFNNTLNSFPVAAGCAGGYSPADGDARYLRVSIDPTSGASEVLSPDIALNSVPSAKVAETVGGLSRAELLQVNTAGANRVDQNNLQAVFNTTQLPILTALLGGTSSLYMRQGGNGAATLPGVSGDAASATPGQIWYDTATNTMKYQSNSGPQVLGVAGAGITGVTAGTGLNVGTGPGGTISTSGTLNIDVGSGVGQIVQVQAGGKLPAVSGADLTNLNGSAINSGTIGGTTAVNTTGTIQSGAITSSGAIAGTTVSATGAISGASVAVTGAVTAASLTTTGSVSSSDVRTNSVKIFKPSTLLNVELVADAALSSSLVFTLPTTLGSNGQVLQVDNAGKMSWTTISGTAPGGSAGGDLGGNYPNPDVVKIRGNAVVSGTLAVGDTGKVYRWSGTQFEAVNFGIDDLKTEGGLSQFATNCNSNQTLTWSVITDAFACTPISINANQITAGTIDAARLPVVAVDKGGTGLSALGTANQVLGVNAAGNAAEYKAITAGSGVTVSHSAGGIQISAAGTGGTVTNVTGSGPIGVATGSTTPVISISQATTSTDGFLSSTDWNTFNSKQVSGAYLTGLSGDVVATGPGSVAATIQANAITTGKINDAAITTNKINDGAVTVNKLGALAVTDAKINDVAWSKITGTPTSLSGYGIADSLVANGGGTPSITSATEGTRPAAGTAGRIFVATDTHRVFRDTGAVWEQLHVNASDLTTGTLPIGRLPALTGDVTSSAGSNSITLNTVPLAKGGTGLTSSGTSNQILGMNNAGTAAEYKSIVAGSGVTVTPSAGILTITATGTGGTVTEVTSANTDIGVATTTTTPVLTLNSGTGANQIVKMNGSAQLPAVSGVNLTNLNANNLASGTIPAARLPAFTGDVTSTAGTASLTLATVPVTKGGTSSTSFSPDQMVVANGAGSALQSFFCPAGNVLKFGAAGVAACDTIAGALGYTPANGTNYVAKAGDTMTGTLNLASNGLVVGTNQLVVSGSAVGIGTNAPNASSILEVTSTSKGFLPPRMTKAQRNAITTPAQGLFVFNTDDNTLDYYNGANWLALNGSAKYIKRGMSGYQTVNLNDIVTFDTTLANSGMTTTGNGVNLKAGVTYRIEASLNTFVADGSGYLGYQLWNGTSTVGSAGYTDEPDSVGSYGFKSAILEIYKPSVDQTISVRIIDDNIGAGQVTPFYNTYFVVTEVVPSGPGGSGADNMGNHAASQNIALGSFWLSGDGGNEGVFVTTAGDVGVGLNNPSEKFEVAGKVKATELCIAADCRSAWPSAGGSGTVTSVTSANSDLSVATTTTTPVITLNTGTGANQILKLNGSSEIPAVSGVNLTNLNANNLASGTLPVARLPAFTGGDVTSSAGSATLTLATVPVNKGGTASTSFTANQMVVANGTGTALQSFSCPLGNVLKFNASGVAACDTIAGALGYTPANGSNYVAKAGDTMTGTLNLPSNGLVVGTNQLVASGGYVGIGTASPGYALDVAGTIRSRGGTAGAGLIFGDRTTAANLWQWYSDTDRARLYRGFNTTADVLTIDQNGNLGVGQSSPAVRLDVFGVGAGAAPATTGATDPTTNLRVSRGAVGVDIGMMDNGTGYLQNRDMANFATNRNFVLNPNGGNIGIGTNSPNEKLSVYNAAATILAKFQTGGAYSAITLQDGTGSVNLVNGGGEFAVQTGTGTEKFRVTAAGNVGVGTPSPSRRLEISGPAGAAGGVQILKLNESTTTDKRASMVFGTGWEVGQDLNMNGTRDFFIFDGNAAAARMVINTAGNVGIGATSPATKLHVLGGASRFEDSTGANGGQTVYVLNNTASGVNYGIVTQATGTGASNNTGVYATASGATSNIGVRVVGTAASANNYAIYADAPAQNYFAGNVGIGTASPAYALDVQGSQQIRVGAPASFNILNNNQLYSNGGPLYMNYSTPNHILMGQGGGNVGIGTVSPTAKLHVYGTAKIDSIYGGEINGAGNFHIDSRGGGALYVNYNAGSGGIYVMNGAAGYGQISAASFNVNSDLRLKKNIEPIASPLEIIDQMEGVRFDWISKNESQRRQVGVIAQDVQKVLPELVSTSEDTKKLTVNYAGLVAPLISAVKELYHRWIEDHARIDALEKENARLKAEEVAKDQRLKALEQKFMQLEERLEKTERKPASR